jgi:hypothetical protein
MTIELEPSEVLLSLEAIRDAMFEANQLQYISYFDRLQHLHIKIETQLNESMKKGECNGQK